MPPTDPKNSKDDLENLGMGELLDMYEKRMSNFAEGDIVRGKVLKITPSEVVIDIGYKSEGLLPISEITGYDNIVKVKPGDEIEVFLERLEDPSGYVILSREKAERMLVWDRIEATIKGDQSSEGRVIARAKA